MAQTTCSTVPCMFGLFMPLFICLGEDESALTRPVGFPAGNKPQHSLPLNSCRCSDSDGLSSLSFLTLGMAAEEALAERMK